MIPAGRVNQDSFEALFQEACVHMPDGHGVSNENFVTALGHFFQYLDTDRLDMDVDPREIKVELMNRSWVLGLYP